MMIVLALSLTIISVMILAYNTGGRIFVEQTSRSELLSRGDTSLGKMTDEIQRSRRVTSAETARIFLWPEDLNGNLSPEGTEIVSYLLQGGDLTRVSSTDSIILTRQATSLAFSYDNIINPKLVTIRLTLTSGNSLITFESKAMLRNK
jgi:hypothetical protein